MRYQMCSKCGRKCRATLNMCPTCYPPAMRRRITKADIGRPIDFRASPDWLPINGVIEDVSRGFVFVRYYRAEATDGRRAHSSEGFTTYLAKSSTSIIAVY